MQVVLVSVPFCFSDKRSAPCFLVSIVNNYSNNWTYIYIERERVLTLVGNNFNNVNSNKTLLLNNNNNPKINNNNHK